MKKRVIQFFCFLLLFAVLALGSGYLFVVKTNKRPLQMLGQSEIVFEVPRGMGSEYLFQKLVSLGWISDHDIDRAYIKIWTYFHPLKQAEYQVLPQMTLSDLLTAMEKGRVFYRQVHWVPGSSFEVVRAQLGAAVGLVHDLPSLSNAALMRTLHLPYQMPEGLFFPDTYFYNDGDTDLHVLLRAYRHGQNILDRLWKTRVPDLPYQTPYEALIVASLIEEETFVPTERPLIASVIINRLRDRMPLQIDPTVIYAAHKPYGATPTRRDLQNESPYNTYLHVGLPPTPIGAPSEASIIAALHPAETQYLYYVVKPGGGHTFSNTYQTHLLAVKVYRVNQQQQKRDIAEAWMMLERLGLLSPFYCNVNQR